MNIKSKYAHYTCLVTLCLFISTNCLAKAFCALRDPVSQIYKLYPQADSYRSIVKTIDGNTRYQVSQKMPQQPLHHGELGRHTLYIVLQRGEAIGIVHVRSEPSRWGLIEIAWALDFDLNVVDFNFQRSRALGNALLLKQSFKKLLIGKQFTELSRYVNIEGQQPNPQFQQQTRGAEALAQIVLVNSLKTLLITQLAWSQEIKALQLQYSARL